MHLRKLPRKALNVETNIRETELLKSPFQDTSKQTVQPKEDKKCETKAQENPQKSSMTLATFNENGSTRLFCQEKYVPAWRPRISLWQFCR